jgi:hypothetical protein
MRRTTKDSRKSTTKKAVANKAAAQTKTTKATAKQAGKNGRGRPPKLVKAFGEEKSLSDWTRDKRCKVTLATLRARLRAGMKPEDAITSPPYQAPGNRNCILVTAFGETKNIRRWAQDRRCKVSYYTLVQRIRTGMDPELAIKSPPVAGFYNKVLFGQKARASSPNYTPHWVMRESRENLPPRPPAKRGRGVVLQRMRAEEEAKAKEKAKKARAKKK